MDRDARALERRATDDENAHTQLMLSKMRAQDIFAPLRTIEQWDATSDNLQDYVIAEVARRVADEFKHTRTKVWRIATCALCDHLDYNAGLCEPHHPQHRCAVFEHKKYGFEMVLVPGSDAVDPFLIARLETSFKVHWHMVDSWYHNSASGGRDGQHAQRNGDLPAQVEGVSVYEIMSNKKKQGSLIRLPDKWEWIHAARSGVSNRPFFWWSRGYDNDYCWTARNTVTCQSCQHLREQHETYHGATELAARCCMKGCGCSADPGESLLFAHQRQPVNYHDDRGRWNAFGLCDTIGNMWELLKHHHIAGGGLMLGHKSIESTVKHQQHISYIGYRMAASIPGT